MAKNTDNHGWPIPESGDRDYEVTFSSFFSELDLDVVLRGTVSNRPSAGKSDRIYIATDEATIYHDNGSSWDEIGGKNFTDPISADSIELNRGGSSDASLQFSSDSNTGIWSPGANRVGIATGGSKGLEIDSSQNLIVPGGDITDGTNTIWDDSNGYIPQGRLENDSVSVAGNSVSLGGTTGVAYGDLSDTGTFPITNSDLSNSSVSVAGNSVSLGGSTSVAYGDLSDTGTFPITNSDLSNSSVSVAGNSVNLGGSTSVAYGDLSDTGTFPITNSDLSNSSITVAGNSISLGGSSSIAHGDLSSAPTEAHHSTIQISDSGSAVMTQPTDVNAGNNLSVTNDGDGTVTIDASGGSGGHSVSDSGTQILSDPSDVDFGGELNVTDDGDGTVSVTTDPSVVVDNLSETIYGSWQIKSDWQFNDDYRLDFGLASDFGLYYHSSNDWLKLEHDPGGTPTDVGRFDTNGDVRFFRDLEASRDILAEQGYLLQSGSTQSNRYGLKYGSANSVDDTDDIMLTNREGGGDTYIAANDGTTGGEAIGLHVPSGASPKPNAPNGLQSSGNDVLTTANGGEVVKNDSVSLSSGSAIASTGITTTGTRIDVALDPSGNGLNAADVKVAARAFWDNSAGEYKIEILEDGTNLGNPTIGYKVIEY